MKTCSLFNGFPDLWLQNKINGPVGLQHKCGVVLLSCDISQVWQRKVVGSNGKVPEAENRRTIVD